MNVQEWQQLSKKQREELWPTLSEIERAAISGAEKAGAAPQPVRPQPKVLAKYSAPLTCALLYGFTIVAMVMAFFLLLSGEVSSAVFVFVAAFSFLAWAQMLDHIAQAAHFTRQTAELLARRLAQE